MIYHLYRWRVINAYNDPYRAPEANPKCLAGYRDKERKAVMTSAIVKAEGRQITTYSGSVYILEDMDPDYRQWLEKNNLSFDPESPLKIIKGK